MPHHPGDAGDRQDRPRPLRLRLPEVDRLCHRAEHHREPDGLDRQRTVDQAWSAHATHRFGRPRPQRRRRLPAEPGRMTVTDEQAEQLEQAEHELVEVWEDAPGIPGFFSTVDHKRIGIRYIYTSFVFFFVAGLV